MKVGLSTAVYYGDKSTEDALALMKSMGVDVCEVFLTTPSEYKPRYIDTLRDISIKDGIRVYSVHPASTQFEPQLFSRTPRQKTDAFEVLNGVLEAASALGAEVYVMHGPMMLKRKYNSSMDYDFIASVASEIAALCKSFGLRFSWENVHWCMYARPGFETEIVKRSGKDVFFTLDIKQATLSGYTPFEYLHAMGDRLTNIHICDYMVMEDGIKLCRPGAGDFDFHRLKRELDSIGYGKNIMLEVYRDNFADEDELRACIAWLKDIFE